MHIGQCFSDGAVLRMPNGLNTRRDTRKAFHCVSVAERPVEKCYGIIRYKIST